MIRVISWNVDGYDQTRHDKLKQLIFANSEPELIFLSETKQTEDCLIEKFKELHNYNFVINVHSPYLYHGVAFLVRKDISFKQICSQLQGCPPRSDNRSKDPCRGRLITLEIADKFYIVGTYVPNSGITEKAIAKQFAYRIKEWDPALFSLLNTYKNIRPTMWLGDINVAPYDIDVSNPSVMVNRAGFRIEERNNLIGFMQTGWIDVWRLQNPLAKVYTWIGYDKRPNYGLRLDNIIVSQSMLNSVSTPFILSTFTWSDHVPVGIYLSLQ